MKKTLDFKKTKFVVDLSGVYAFEKTKDGYTNVGEMETDDFGKCPLFANKQISIIDIFNKNLLCFATSENSVIVATQYAPQKYEIRNARYKYNLSLPYIQHIAKYGKLDNKMVYASQSYITCTNQPVTNIDDKLNYIPLPNLHSDCRICWGSVEHKGNLTDIITYSNQAFNLYIGSKFSGDLRDQIPFPKEFKTYAEWVGYKEEITKATWKQYVTLKEIIHATFKDRDN